MVNHPLWSDEYWLLLLQLYLKKPVGIKQVYSKPMVKLGMELHIHPKLLHELMYQLRRRETRSIERLWQTLGTNPKLLNKKCRQLRHKAGFGNAGLFYQGVTIHETWEWMFEPLETIPQLMPVMLIIILDLYFCLTPLTMVPETPEIGQLSRLMHVKSDVICDVMKAFQNCDPCLKTHPEADAGLIAECRKIWNEHSIIDQKILSRLAEDLKAFFLSK